MPTVTVEGPILREIEKKRSLVKGITDVVAETYGIEHVTVLIRENPPENVGVGGVLIADRHGARGSD